MGAETLVGMIAEVSTLTDVAVEVGIEEMSVVDVNV